MTKCLFKALKAVDLEAHINSFRSLGYDSAGALARFRTEHFEQLNLKEQELLRLISLLDVLKEATGEGKSCPHYFQSSRITKPSTTNKSAAIRASWSDETHQQQRHSQVKQTNDHLQPRKSTSSMGFTGRAPSATTKSVQNYANELIFQRPSTVTSRSPRMMSIRSNSNQRPKSFLNRPTIQHVKVNVR